MSDQSTTLLPPDLGGPPEPLTPAPRHRRGLRVTLIAAVAALVLAIPLVLFFVLRGDTQKEVTTPRRRPARPPPRRRRRLSPFYPSPQADAGYDVIARCC
jgi:hypothetical protein